MAKINLEIRLLPKQMEFLNANEREVLFSGAFGAGKSQALCHKLLQHARIPGNFVGLCRKERKSLTVTTLRTLIEEILDPLRAELGAKVYEHQLSKSMISIEGGGRIYYFGFDKDIKMGSLSFGAVAIDEATEIEEREYTMLLGRLRAPQDPNPQLFAACNPSAPSHYLHKRFFEERSESRRVICTKSGDNVFLPEAYQDILGSFAGQARARYVEGQWVAFEGLVYDRWDRGVFVRDREDYFAWTVCGVDDGFTNPFAVSVWGIDGDGRMHLVREIYQSKLLPAAKVEMLSQVGADLYVVDPSAASLIADMQAAGMNVEPGDNDVRGGILCTQDLFTIPGDGIPRFTVSPECPAFVREVEAYSWKEGQDKPEPVMDHLMDGWRYLVKWLHDNWTVQPVEMLVHPGAAMPR